MTDLQLLREAAAAELLGVAAVTGKTCAYIKALENRIVTLEKVNDAAERIDCSSSAEI